MAKTTIEERLAQQAPALPQFIEATYEGVCYGNGTDDHEKSFKVTVKWPFSAVENDEYSPVALFKKYKWRQVPGATAESSIRFVRLAEINGVLPDSMAPMHELLWTTSRDRLLQLAKQHGKQQYIKTDLIADKQTREWVELRAELFPDSDTLRRALRMIISAPEGFVLEQERMELRNAKVPKSMEADINALADPIE